MPRISDQILNSVVFLYKSAESARMGKPSGGSGFLAGVPSERHADQLHCYAVTNSHVINQGYSVVRMTTADGKSEILTIGEGQWKCHPAMDDLAVCLIPRPAAETLSLIPSTSFLTREGMQEHDIGPGDDVFLAGRFTGYEGKQGNTPTVRFGVVSMMPSEPIFNANTGFKQESFLIETHSMTGYSGSPVFVQRLPMTPLPGRPGLPMYYREWFLGIEWGHIPYYDAVVDEGGKPHPEGWRVQSNTAVAAVVPAWKLLELLDDEDLIEQRLTEDDRIAAELNEAIRAEVDGPSEVV